MPFLIYYILSFDKYLLISTNRIYLSNHLTNVYMCLIKININLELIH